MIDCFYIIKSLDIGYITTLYLISAYICAYYIDIFFTHVYGDDHTKKSIEQLFFELVVQVVLTSIVSYIMRNVIVQIGSPFHGVCNFDHYRVKELNSSPILLMFLMLFQKNLQKKISKIRELL